MAESIVNICFHGIGTPARELEPGESRYWITVDAYKRVLDEIATWPSVRISFDDGNASDIEIGLPELVERGLTADFFVLAGRLSAPGSLSEAAVKELAASGMTIGTHGMRHVPWRGLSPDGTKAELVEARERIAACAGTVVDTAACPLGRYDRRLLNDLRGLGYRRVFTSDRRAARADAWLQPRFSVRSGDTAESFRAEALTRPGIVRTAKASLIGAIKRWR
jgi:peptidoglycan/xylan/chitin deacetylase (PgdA/CDA1 family)